MDSIEKELSKCKKIKVIEKYIELFIIALKTVAQEKQHSEILFMSWFSQAPVTFTKQNHHFAKLLWFLWFASTFITEGNVHFRQKLEKKVVISFPKKVQTLNST